MEYKRVLFPFGFPTKLVVFLAVICMAAGTFLCPPIVNAGLTYLGEPPLMVWWQGFLVGLIPLVLLFGCILFQFFDLGKKMKKSYFLLLAFIVGLFLLANKVFADTGVCTKPGFYWDPYICLAIVFGIIIGISLTLSYIGDRQRRIWREFFKCDVKKSYLPKKQISD